MVRFYIVAAIVGLAFTLFSLLDAALIDPRRARGVPKPVWIVLTVLLPVIGGVLWFTIGRSRTVPAETAQQLAPDDDPRFTGGADISKQQVDERIRDLEARLAELDAEVFPGEPGAAGGATSADQQQSTETPEDREANPEGDPRA